MSVVVALVNPKFAHNVGAVIRAASCFGVEQVWYNGGRIDEDLRGRSRIPREERMRAYGSVQLCRQEYFYDALTDYTPVAVEVTPNAEPLPLFEHPERALYVFGPEDGGLGKVDRMHCHRHVQIPTRHCTNLAAAVYIVLYDRLLKQVLAGEEALCTPGEFEGRGYDSRRVETEFGVSS